MTKSFSTLTKTVGFSGDVTLESVGFYLAWYKLAATNNGCMFSLHRSTGELQKHAMYCNRHAVNSYLRKAGSYT